MSSTFDRCVHPVLACADSIATALKETADVQVTFMDPGDKRTHCCGWLGSRRSWRR